jgi:hypothetical protein
VGDVLACSVADLDHAECLVIDLERGVLDAKLLLKHLLKFATDRMAIVSGMDEDVR